MIFAIGDLHLSLGMTKKKPMDIFGNKWSEHHLRIKENWTNAVNQDDLVLIPGDVSWAMTAEEFDRDIEFIHSLPGKKIITNGNHDYWWNSTAKLNAMYEEIFFLKNSCAEYGGLYICGSRGWICPNDTCFTTHDLKIYKRELIRLKLSLDEAMRSGAEKIIVMLHYPPFNDKKEGSGFIDIIKSYPVETVVYGHLHGDGCYGAVNGLVDGIVYRLVSADGINFNPLRVL